MHNGWHDMKPTIEKKFILIEGGRSYTITQAWVWDTNRLNAEDRSQILNNLDVGESHVYNRFTGDRVCRIQ